MSLSLRTNLAVMAGAGTGKTHALVTLALGLLGGARPSGEPIRPGQLCLVTFTDKAASELKARVRQRLLALAQAPLTEQSDPELFRAFAALGLPAPTPAVFRGAAEGLGAAFIGTFHGLALQLLRSAPVGSAGIPAGFELLDEEEGEALLRDVVERVVLEALSGDEAPVAALARDVDLGGWDFQGGLLSLLLRTYVRLREDGVDPGALPIGDVAQLKEGFERALGAARRTVGEAAAANIQEGRPFAPLLDELRAALGALSWEEAPRRFPALSEALQRSPELLRVRKGLGAAVKRLRQELFGDRERAGVFGYVAAAQAVPHEATFRELLGRIRAAHGQAQDRRGALDFAELLLRARALLERSPEARRAAHARFRALLVDEFQDTNAVQWELLCLLAERREGAPREAGAAPGGPGALPLEPGFLAVVGDRKQSIYEFRGADVSVFGRVAGRLRAEGGVPVHLRHNRRSSAELISFFNAVFARLMRPEPEPRDYQVGYHPASDDLVPVRAGGAGPGGPAVERLTFAADGRSASGCRALEAELLARRLEALLSSGGTAPGDVAVLFQRLTCVEVYRQALLRRGISARVVRGRGFYGAQEVLDLASVLALMGDPADAVSLAAVLRSPWVGLSDAALLRLAWANGQRLSFGALAPDRLEAVGLAGDERERLLHFLAWFEPLRSERWLKVHQRLEHALNASGYRQALAAGPSAEQALANVDKLLSLAEAWEREGRGDARQLGERVLHLADADPKEAQADLPAADGAVLLLTVHQAKGLEWPVVVVADLGAEPGAPSGDAFLYDRAHGLAMRPPEMGPSPRALAVADEAARRERAESMRRLYVALTRARDRLILSGVPSRRRQSWREALDEIIEAPEVRPLVRDLGEAELPELAGGPGPGAPEPDPASSVAEVLSRVRGERRPAGPAALTVDALEDFARCSRRYLYVHVAGLRDGAGGLEPRVPLEDALEWELPAGHPLQRPVLLRRAIGRLDFGLATRRGREREAALLRLARGLGLQEGTEPFGALVERLSRLLDSELAREVAAARPGRVFRDRAYRLPMPGGATLAGTIDLVLARGEGALAVDFCAAPLPADGPAPYAVRLAAHRRALRAWFPGAPVEVGLVFLDAPAPRLWLPAGPGADLEGVAAELGRAPARAAPALAQARCAQLRCGFVARCHG